MQGISIKDIHTGFGNQVYDMRDTAMEIIGGNELCNVDMKVLTHIHFVGGVIGCYTQ